MKSLKNTVRDNKRKVGSAVSSFFKPKIKGVGTRLRLAARIRILNSKASHNPKMTCAIVVSVLTLIFVGNMAFTIAQPKRETVYQGVDPAGLDTVFAIYQEIQDNKDVQRHAVNEMTLAGKSIRNKLDSLMRLPVKTREDSLEIVKSYRRLDKIVSYLNNGKKPNKDDLK